MRQASHAVNETVPKNEPRSRGGLIRGARFRLGALVALAAIAGIVIWLAVGGNNSTSPAPGAVEISPPGLKSLAGALRQPIYWVGPATNVTYELTRPGEGRILLGYVQSGESDKDPHLTIGTYPMTNAYAVTQNVANGPHTVKIKVGGGAVAFYNKRYPLSAFISYPGSSFQIEVYDPTPGRARELVASGKVQPVPGSPSETTSAAAVSGRGLIRRALAEHQPIYWAGPAPKGGTLELTKTSKRWFLVRYLPAGVEVGAAGVYLTIGTYPVTHALDAVKSLAAEKGASTIDLGGGGLAVVNPKHFPNSILLAYPGSNYQVEVFDPSLAHAKRLVKAGRISAVG